MDDTTGDLMDDVRESIATLTAPWTLDQLASAVGTDVESVRPCVERMIEGGTVHPLGPDPRDEGSGPMLYGPRPFDTRPG